MNSAALCYVHKPTAKRTPDTLTHQSSRVYFSLRLSSIIYAIFSSGTKIKTPSSILKYIGDNQCESQCGRELRKHCVNVKRFSSLSLGFSFEVSPNIIKNTKDFVLNGNTEKNQVQVFLSLELRWQ